MLRVLALSFVLEEDPFLHFMVRGCVAYGPVWDGESLMKLAGNRTLNAQPNYTKQILLGPPIRHAFEEEHKAAPYGIWVHESARTMAPAKSHPLTCTHWNWWMFNETKADTELAQTLAKHLKGYLAWCAENHTRLIYPADRIEAHRTLVEQYYKFD